MNRKRLGTVDALGWSMVGFALGVVGGLWAGGALGRVTRARISEGIDAFRAPDAPSPVALAQGVEALLAADPALAALALRVVPVTRGTVELTGWVPDRATRARTIRLAARVPGLVTLNDSILVRGEDDLPGPPILTLEDRPA